MDFRAVLVVLALTGVRAPIAPVNEGDPEPNRDWTTPSSPSFFRYYTPGAQHVGNLFAGRSEFPYIVRISSPDIDAEQWGIGNLITFSHVLTSAREVEFVLNSHRLPDIEPGKKMDEGLLVSLEYITARILYCAQYLYEDYKFNNKLTYVGYDMFDHDVHESGSRFVRFMFKHPFYRKDRLSYDVGIMRTNFPIRPMPPLQDYMPVWYDLEEEKITDIDLHLMDSQRRICYIASFGLQWYNYQSAIEISNYKVRYRVYWERLDECVRRLGFYQRTDRQTPLEYNKFEENHLMCFKPRAKVGSVCDHDRGGPLVCDGRVYGFVSRAANWTFCNNLLPLPFIVIKSAALDKYYAELSKGLYFPYNQPKGASEKNLACVHLVILSFLAVYWRRQPELPTGDVTTPILDPV